MFLKLSTPSLTHSTWEYLQNSLAHPAFDWRHHCLLAIFIHLVRASKHSAACWFQVNFSSMLCSLKVLVMSLKLLSWSLCGSLNKCCLHLGLVNLEDFCSSFFATSAAVRCFAEFQPVPRCHLYFVMYWYSHDSSQKREGSRKFARKKEDEIIQLHLATVFTYNLWQNHSVYPPLLSMSAAGDSAFISLWLAVLSSCLIERWKKSKVQTNPEGEPEKWG